MVTMNMDLNSAIKWAEKQSSRYLEYHVLSWNDQYMVCTKGQLGRYKENRRESIYNTKDKKLNHSLIPTNGFQSINTTTRKKILSSGRKIAPSFICTNPSLTLGDTHPKEGTIIQPYYFTDKDVYYKFGGGKHSLDRMNRLCAYFKVYEEDHKDTPSKIDIPKNRFIRVFRKNSN